MANNVTVVRTNGLFRGFKKAYVFDQMKADHKLSGNLAKVMRENVSDALITHVEDGVTKQFYDNRPVEAMSDREWFEEAVVGTKLENITNPTAVQMSFVRKVAYEATGNDGDIFNQDHFINRIVRKAMDADGHLCLDDIASSVENAWNEMYPNEVLVPAIEEWAFFVTCGAIVDWVGDDD